MWFNKVECSTYNCVYCLMHDAKVPFCMPEFSSSKIIHHCFHVNNDKGNTGVGYYIIIGRDLMVQIGLKSDFKNHVLQWDGATVHMKEPSVMLGQSYLTKRNMREVDLQTSETASTMEAIELIVKIIDSTYVKADLKQVDNHITQLNDE